METIVTCGTIPDSKIMAILSSGSRILLAHKDHRIKPGTQFNETRQIGIEMKSRILLLLDQAIPEFIVQYPFGFFELFLEICGFLLAKERSEIFGTD